MIGLFILGLWMVSLDYYHEWYRTAPDLHRSFGVVLMLLTITRLVWYRISPKPKALSHYAKWEHITATAVQHSMIATLFVLFFSGYLITTAQGDSLFVFNVIEIPALISGSVIVSVVMSLPTLGPVMLQAMEHQQPQLGGTIILLLGALSVVGTLISDLLLVVVDPRIRLTGSRG